MFRTQQGECPTGQDSSRGSLGSEEIEYDNCQDSVQGVVRMQETGCTTARRSDQKRVKQGQPTGLTSLFHLGKSPDGQKPQRKGEQSILIGKVPSGTGKGQIERNLCQECHNKQVPTVFEFAACVEKALHQQESKQRKGNSAHRTQKGASHDKGIMGG